MQKAAVFVIAILGIVITGLLAALVQQNSRVAAEPQLTTPWSGVLLTNGQAFFGRLEKAGSAFPVLRDVYYVRSQVNQETKQVTNTLVKRGQEWHGRGQHDGAEHPDLAGAEAAAHAQQTGIDR